MTFALLVALAWTYAAGFIVLLYVAHKNNQPVDLEDIPLLVAWPLLLPIVIAWNWTQERGGKE